jgi:hypothetical protein
MSLDIDSQNKSKANLYEYIFSTNLIPKLNSTDELILYFIQYNLDIVNNNTINEDVHVTNYYAPIILIESDSISKPKTI